MDFSPYKKFAVPEDVGDSSCREAYAFWRSLAADGGLPALAEFDLLEIPHLVPLFCRVDLTDGGQTATCRLVGSEVVRTHGTDRTGYVMTRDKWDEEDSAGMKRFIGLIFFVFDHGTPCSYGPVKQRVEGREFITVEVVGFPLTADGGGVKSVMTFLSIEHYTDE